MEFEFNVFKSLIKNLKPSNETIFPKLNLNYFTILFLTSIDLTKEEVKARLKVDHMHQFFIWKQFGIPNSKKYVRKFLLEVA